MDPLSTLPNNTTEVHLLGYKQLLLILTGTDCTICPNCGANLIRRPLPETSVLLATLSLDNPLLDSS
jgi:hypothetical protein